MKNYIILILISLFVACSSSYTPSDKMLEYKKNMTAEQASNILQKLLWNTENNLGICGSRGFWYDEDSDIKVYEDKIKLLAHKRGKELKKLNKGFDDVVVFEKQYYYYTFEFSKVVSIDVYDDPFLLPVFPTCNKKDISNSYLIIDLNVSDLSNIKFIIYPADFDELMAGLTILMPTSAVKIK